jgi:hypothetical protein
MRQRPTSYAKSLAAIGGLIVVVPVLGVLVVLALMLTHVFFGAAGVIILASLIALLFVALWQARQP